LKPLGPLRGTHPPISPPFSLPGHSNREVESTGATARSLISASQGRLYVRMAFTWDGNENYFSTYVFMRLNLRRMGSDRGCPQTLVGCFRSRGRGVNGQVRKGKVMHFQGPPAAPAAAARLHASGPAMFLYVCFAGFHRIYRTRTPYSRAWVAGVLIPRHLLNLLPRFMFFLPRQPETARSSSFGSFRPGAAGGPGLGGGRLWPV